MERQTIFNSAKEKGAKNFTVISCSILRKEDLSLDETGILSYLLSLLPNWRVVKKNVEWGLKDRISRGRFKSAWKGLAAKGYLRMIKDKQPGKNIYGEVYWLVFDIPE